MRIADFGGKAGTRAAASLEFAIITPVFGVLLAGLVDVADALVAERNLNAAVQQIGLTATQLSMQPDQSTTLTVAQTQTAASVIFSVFSGLSNAATYNSKTNPAPSYAIVVSDIVFTPTGTDCTAGLTCSGYTANVAWSVPLQYGQPLNRACGVVNQVGSATTPGYLNNIPTTIPTAGISNALTSMLVVDAVYQFTPIFGAFVGPITMRQTAYFNQRSIVAPYITYNTAGLPTAGVLCTGYT